MAQNGTVFLADTEMRVGEQAGSAVARIIRSGSLANEVKITYGVTGNTATDGQDFVGGFGTVTMAAGASEVSVPVRLLDDNLAEPTEVLVFSLVNVEGATLWAPRTSRISILDNETPAPPPAAEPPLSTDYDVRQVPLVTGLNLPIKFEFSPVDASRAYVAEKGGVIRLANLQSGTSSYVVDLGARVNEHQDRGLMDVILHPDFVNKPYLYAFYVVDPPGTAGQGGNAGADGAGNRYAQLVRFTLDASTGYSTVVANSEVTLLGKGGRSLADISGGGAQDFTNPGLSGATASDRYVNPASPAPLVNGFKQDYLKVDSASHVGGALAFGPDGALYVSTGDGTSFDYADPRTPDVLSLDSLSGKVLRIDPLTGRGLADNPFATADLSLDSNRAKVFQSGLRNPFSMTFDDEGRLFITNTGWNSYEMINTGGPGANFGWPYFEGGDNGTLLQAPTYRDFASAPSFYAGVANGTIKVSAPFRAFSHGGGDPGFQVQAITGGKAIYGGSVYPAALKDDLFFADFSGGEIYTVDVNDRTAVKFLYFATGPTGPVDFVEGPDGSVYYADIATGEIGRLAVTALPPAPAPAGPTTTTIGTGPDTLALRISQEAYKGSAFYTVSVDGQRIGGALAASGLRGNGQFDTVNVRGDWAPGSHTAVVTFLNDAYDGSPATDRNLYIDGATYNGVAVPGAARALPAGPASFAFTEPAAPPAPTAPTTPTTTTVGTGPDTLVLRVSQDFFQTSAQYTVSVDSVQIGGTLTASGPHASNQSDTVNVLGNWAAGNHTVALNYLNDVNGSTAATDRNLYLDGATYNGAALTGVARSLPSGSSNFAFTEAPPTVTRPTAPVTLAVGTGADSLVLRISQDFYQDSAQYVVRVDNTQVGGTLTAAGVRGSTQPDTVTVRGDWAPGSHTATVEFLNDAYGGTGDTDRNLYVDGATYNGVAVPNAGQVLYVGAGSFGFTDTAAPPPPTTTAPTAPVTLAVGTGTDSLVLRISQDFYQGSAQYTVSVDGTQVGGTLTAAGVRGSTQPDTVTVRGDWAPGSHSVVVNFLNDAYGGTGDTDRNLYVDGATYNGAAVPNAGQVLFAGAGSFNFTDTAAPPAPTPTAPTAPTTTAVGAGADSLVLRISQDFYQGSAQYVVRVDGTQVGGTLTASGVHGVTQSDTVTVRGNWAPGTHNVAVEFLNDAFGGTGDTDRNLYIDGATYNGATVNGAGQLIYVGTGSFSVSDLSPLA